MSFESKVTHWDKSHKSARERVLAHLKEANEIKARNQGHEDFYRVTKLLIETERNPYGFLEEGSWFDTWQSTEAFIHNMRHCFLDDGEYCYLSDEIYGPMIIFRCRYDYKSEEELYATIKPSIARYRKAGLGHANKKTYEFHHDTQRFINEFHQEQFKENRVRTTEEAFFAKH